MHRVMVYDQALPQTTDILNTNKFAMIDAAYQNAAILGTSTVVAGLACTPSTPTPDLHVNIAVGSIFEMDPTDAAAYADLGTDNTTIMKQGILAAPQVLTITPPSTSGFSQNYLVQVSLTDVDAGSQVLSFYNSANPAQPYAGPANSGTSSFTVRQCNCNVALKPGIAATTGTQTTPSPDAGFIGLYVVTVSNGQTQITSGNIAQLASAPFFPTLPQVPAGVQKQSWVYAGQDTGTANAYVITFAAGQPIPTAYTPGMKVSFKALNANTAASTVNVNGLGAVSIRRATGVALSAADINSGQVVELTYDGTNFQMANYLGAGTTSNTSTSVNIPYVADSGTQNALVGTYTPAITSGQQVAGLVIAIKLANAITGACTINVNGLGAKSVTLGDGTNPPFNVFVAGEILLLEYDGTKYQIVNTSAAMFYIKPTSNYNIYVNASTGSDTLYDGTSPTVGSGTSGPFKTIQHALTVACGYAPSAFTITINIAAGTYNENPVSPNQPTSNIIISGAGTGSTVIASASAGSYAMVLQGANTYTVQNLTFQGTAVHGLTSQYNAIVNVTNVGFNNSLGGSNGAHMLAWLGGNISIVGATSIGGNCGSVVNSANSGAITYGPSVVQTISTAIGVSQGYAEASQAGTVGVLNPNPPIFVNPSNAVGPKYVAQLNGIVYAAGLGYSFFPGTVAGTTNSGGQYQP